MKLRTGTEIRFAQSEYHRGCLFNEKASRRGSPKTTCRQGTGFCRPVQPCSAARAYPCSVRALGQTWSVRRRSVVAWRHPQRQALCVQSLPPYPYPALPDAPAMGSLDWGWCAWCWRPVQYPYLIDGLGALCDTCDQNSREGFRPPWQPDGRARVARWLVFFFHIRRLPPNSRPLPDQVRDLIAEFLEYRCTP